MCKIVEEEVCFWSWSKGCDWGFKEDEEFEIVIVILLGYEEDKKLEKSFYDVFNVDVWIDNEIFFVDIYRFCFLERDLYVFIFKFCDFFVEWECLLFNLVMLILIFSWELMLVLFIVSRLDVFEVLY